MIERISGRVDASCECGVTGSVVSYPSEVRNRVPRKTRGLRAGVLLLLVALATGACAAGDESVAPTPTPEREAIRPLQTPTPTGSNVHVEPTPGATAPDPTTESVTPSPVDCLPVRSRMAQLLMPLVTQSELDAAVTVAAAGDLGGIALLGMPDSRLRAQLEALEQASFASVLVASDEEGGSVQRLTNVIWPLPSAATQTATSTPDAVRQQFEDYAIAARDLGVDVIFGPVLDVGGGPGIGSRSFGEDPAVVAEFGRAVAEGLQAGGVLPVFKHFPGHGRATDDSHLALPTTPGLEDLRSRDLLPYVELLSDDALGDSAAVMVAHLAVPGLSDDVPTSLSPAAIDGLLRDELGFEGIVFTDALNMGAIADTYGPLDAIELSLRAGADVAIVGSLVDLGPTLDHFTALAESDPGFRTLIDNRAARVLAVKGDGDLCQGAQ